MVDTSQLIKDERDIFSTSKLACVFKGDQLAGMMSSPTKNILSRIFNEKMRLRPEMVEERETLDDNFCLISRTQKVFQFFKFDFFILVPRITANIFVAMIDSFDGLLGKVWISEKAIYQYNLVIYYTLRSQGNKKRIDSM